MQHLHSNPDGLNPNLFELDESLARPDPVPLLFLLHVPATVRPGRLLSQSKVLRVGQDCKSPVHRALLRYCQVFVRCPLPNIRHRFQHRQFSSSGLHQWKSMRCAENHSYWSRQQRFFAWFEPLQRVLLQALPIPSMQHLTPPYHATTEDFHPILLDQNSEIGCRQKNDFFVFQNVLRHRSSPLRHSPIGVCVHSEARLLERFQS